MCKYDGKILVQNSNGQCGVIWLCLVICMQIYVHTSKIISNENVKFRKIL